MDDAFHEIASLVVGNELASSERGEFAGCERPKDDSVRAYAHS